jgi:hypothetical protein
MKVIVPVVLSVVLALVATLVAITITRLIAPHDVRIDPTESPDVL